MTRWRCVQVGGRSTVSQTITQSVEIRNSEEERFERLLQLLSEHDEADGKMLIFVNSQDKCSKLYQDLLTYGYANLMLHGDMPQVRAAALRAGCCVLPWLLGCCGRKLHMRCDTGTHRRACCRPEEHVRAAAAGAPVLQCTRMHTPARGPCQH